jgi:hypothetical protein
LNGSISFMASIISTISASIRIGILSI